MVILSTSTSTQIPNHKPSKNKRHKQTTEETSYQTGEVEKNYKMFANPVFITPGRSTYPIILDRKFSYIKKNLIENCKKNYK